MFIELLTRENFEHRLKISEQWCLTKNAPDNPFLGHVNDFKLEDTP